MTPAIILPPVLFGNIFWYSHLLRGAEVWVNEPYRKQTLRNRIEICGPQGRLPITFPVNCRGQEYPPQDQIPVVFEPKMRIRHVRTLRTSYGSAPFYIHYIDALEDFIMTRTDNLLELNLKSHDTMRWALPELPALCLTHLMPGLDTKDITGCFKTSKKEFITLPYAQVFEHKFGYLANLSIIDALMHLGPQTTDYLKNTPLSSLSDQQIQTET